ncbi:hypothetical protein BDA99DRAFT_297744 [Phascolomyces articulosus]|uniref:F-box domain-containing protein n=1 Tax=Phascolomyces articulosus TaxID=60185 RepID=A0AAD5K651_9FUNG|nr:hypothetical protein BDA99DRAFT_297744 [Phascolomyces articulosus]
MENNLPFKSSPPPPLFQKYPFTQELGLPVLQQQFDYSVHQLSLGNGKRAGACFTEVIKTINSNVLASTYLHRSAAFAMQGKQGPAVQDIYKAIHLSPAQPDGYIYAYNVFVSFKRYREAFLALTEGLKQVNKADRKYAALGFMKDSLLAEIDNKNSLPLPYDVITSILRRLSFRDRIHLASTCKYWERMLHESPPIMWHDIDIRSPMGVGQFQRLLSHVDSFYVRRVKADTHEMLNEINNVEWRHIECLGKY